MWSWARSKVAFIASMDCTTKQGEFFKVNGDWMTTAHHSSKHSLCQCVYCEGFRSSPLERKHQKARLTEGLLFNGHCLGKHPGDREKPNKEATFTNICSHLTHMNLPGRFYALMGQQTSITSTSFKSNCSTLKLPQHKWCEGWKYINPFCQSFPKLRKRWQQNHFSMSLVRTNSTDPFANREKNTTSISSDAN